MENNFKILVLDDDPGVLNLLKKKLAKTAYEYEYEQNPLVAIEKIRNDHFDMLILDFNMNPINGDEVIKRVNAIDRTIYKILLTGETGKTLVNPSQFIQEQDIQSYCVKSTDLLQLVLLVELGIKKIISDRIVRMYNEGINELLKLVPKLYINGSVDIENKKSEDNHKDIIDNILKQLMCLFVNASDSFIILKVNINGEQKTTYRGIGKYQSEIDDFVKMLDPEFMESWLFVQANNTIEKVKNGMMFPLNDESGRNIGVLFLENIVKENEAYFDIVNMFAYQVASALVVNIKNEELVIANEKLNEHFLDTVEALRIAVDEKDRGTLGHSSRVAFFAKKLGQECNCTDEEIKLLTFGGLFHDIGKLGIPDNVLLKPDRLTDEEVVIMKKHTDKGERLITSIKQLENTVDIVKYHHEAVNGSGYYKLKGNDIPFLARIVAIVDAYDAMTSDRPYRNGMSVQAAIVEMRKNEGKQFDEEIAEKFINLLEKHYGEWKEYLDKTREYAFTDKDLPKLAV